MFSLLIKLDTIDVAQLVDKKEFSSIIEELISTMIENRKYFKKLDEDIKRSEFTSHLNNISISLVSGTYTTRYAKLK